MKLAWGSWSGLLVGVVLVGAGVLLGFIGTRSDAAARRRERELEDEVRRLRDEQDRYRESVAEHFGRASEIFGNLTGEYRALYTHLAEGAEHLASDRIPALRFDRRATLPPDSDHVVDPEDGEGEAVPRGLEVRGR